MAVPLKPKPALIATVPVVAAYHNYVPAGETFPVKTAAAAGFSEGAMVLFTTEPELGNRHILSRWRPWGPAQPSRLGIVTARLLGDHLGPEVSREPSLSGFNAPWALIITTYHIGHYCVVRTAKKVGL